MGEDLARECRAWTRCLAGVEPDADLLGKYATAHATNPGLAPDGRFDAALVRAAARGPRVARMADAYARFAAPRGALRKKLVLALAILETGRLHRRVDELPHPSRATAWIALAAHGASAAISLAAGTLIFAPLQLWCALGRR